MFSHAGTSSTVLAVGALVRALARAVRALVRTRYLLRLLVRQLRIVLAVRALVLVLLSYIGTSCPLPCYYSAPDASSSREALLERRLLQLRRRSVAL